MSVVDCRVSLCCTNKSKTPFGTRTAKTDPIEPEQRVSRKISFAVPQRVETKNMILTVRLDAGEYSPPKQIVKTMTLAMVQPEFKLEAGFKTKKGSDEEAEPENLPPLEKGDPATVAETKIDRKQTPPPPQYSDALLSKDMTNPCRYVRPEGQTIHRGPGQGMSSDRNPAALRKSENPDFGRTDRPMGETPLSVDSQRKPRSSSTMLSTVLRGKPSLTVQPRNRPVLLSMRFSPAGVASHGTPSRSSCMLITRLSPMLFGSFGSWR